MAPSLQSELATIQEVTPCTSRTGTSLLGQSQEASWRRKRPLKGEWGGLAVAPWWKEGPPSAEAPIHPPGHRLRALQGQQMLRIWVTSGGCCRFPGGQAGE